MGFAARCAELRRFAAKNWRTVEETVKSAGNARVGRDEAAALQRGLVATDATP